jgi:hypothetical protein
MSGMTSTKGMPQCLALNSPAGSYRYVEESTTPGPGSIEHTLKLLRQGRINDIGSLRGFGVRVQFKTPSISRKMIRVILSSD